MDHDVIFARAFCGEVEKLGMEKEGILFSAGLAAGALVGAGASALGLSGFGKPKDVLQKKWFRWGEVPKVMGHTLSLSSAAAPGVGGLLGAGFRALGVGEALSSGKGTRAGLPWRPPSIARTPLNRQPRRMAGGF